MVYLAQQSGGKFMYGNGRQIHLADFAPYMVVIPVYERSKDGFPWLLFGLGAVDGIVGAICYRSVADRRGVWHAGVQGCICGFHFPGTPDGLRRRRTLAKWSSCR
jgi:hypothetical protein